jgi:hypothetical protein
MSVRVIVECMCVCVCVCVNGVRVELWVFSQVFFCMRVAAGGIVCICTHAKFFLARMAQCGSIWCNMGEYGQIGQYGHYGLV